MESDFPAAHSADTTWYAVDRDGHVACFDSGEEGLIPTGVPYMDDVVVSDWLHAAATAGGVPVASRGRSVRRSRHGEHCTLRPGTKGPVIFFLTSEDAVMNEVINGRARFVPAGRGAAAVFDKLPRGLARRLHDANACLGCYAYDEPQLFYYSPSEYGPAPYERESVPQRPLHVDQLPPEVREAVSRVRFDKVSFAEAPSVQPVEHLPCGGWGECPFYVASDGRHLRAMPGCEEAYRALYEQAQRGEFDMGDYIWEPPPEAPPRRRRSR
jgi:hypothetical protein